MPYGYYGYYFDPTYILIIIAAIISLIAQWRVNSAFSKYSRVAEHVRNDRCTGSKNDFAVKRNK